MLIWKLKIIPTVQSLTKNLFSCWEISAKQNYCNFLARRWRNNRPLVDYVVTENRLMSDKFLKNRKDSRSHEVIRQPYSGCHTLISIKVDLWERKHVVSLTSPVLSSVHRLLSAVWTCKRGRCPLRELHVHRPFDFVTSNRIPMPYL